MRVVVHAPNIHQGGGAVLLAALMAPTAVALPRLVIVDERYVMPGNTGVDVVVKRIRPTLSSRVGAEWYLRQTTTAKDVVLCLGNLPPLFRLRARVTLFAQNRLLIDNIPLDQYRWMTRLRILAERLWLRARLGNVQRVLVQTCTMQRLVANSLGLRADVLPFLPATAGKPGSAKQAGDAVKNYDFLYVSSGEPHKNHMRLIAAWKLLAEENVRPHLGLTLCPIRDVELCRLVADARATHDVNITNIGPVPREHIHEFYAQAEAFIYPSTLESFGLPLLEATAAGLPIVAAELDYVRDLLDPAQTFDASSPLSIGRAVKRQLGISDQKSIPVDARAFLHAVLEDT
jgi:glycosyltransferase involved in cell wall biosynthesis